MPAFFEYLRNITYYLMFATVVGMFAPAGRYRKFVSLVLGFVLLLLMIQPLAAFFGGRDVPVTEWFISAMPRFEYSAETAYSDWWDTHLRGAFETQLEAQLVRLLNANGFEVHSAEFCYADDFGTLNSIRVRLSRAETPTPDRVPFIRIQPPQISPIQIGEPSAPEETCPDADAAKILISQFYNLPKSHIHVEVI